MSQQHRYEAQGCFPNHGSVLENLQQLPTSGLQADFPSGSLQHRLDNQPVYLETSYHNFNIPGQVPCIPDPFA
jgi:hypothetical protein